MPQGEMTEAGSSAQDGNQNEESPKRSHRTKAKEQKPKEARYSTDDIVWLAISGKPGSYKMTVVDRAQHLETKKWEYQLKDTDGELYERGKWVPEAQLNSKE